MKNPDFSRVKELYLSKKEAFDAFGALLREYNQRYNLTRITSEEETKYKHFYDSLAGEYFFPAGARVCEVGSGGGFPSIPLKIVRDDLSFTLVESTGKKCEFLKVAVRELGLKNVEVVHARAEELAREKNYREAFDLCCARAVARLNTLCEYCMPFVKKGGLFLAYKGDAAEEIEQAASAVKILGGKGIESVSYELEKGYGARTLVAVEKERATPFLYPRGNGKERTKPL